MSEPRGVCVCVCLVFGVLLSLGFASLSLRPHYLVSHQNMSLAEFFLIKSVQITRPIILLLVICSLSFLWLWLWLCPGLSKTP